jgi:hypothetical protein
MLERAHTNRLLPKRDLRSDSCQPMRVRLVRKLANVLNGIDLSHVKVGDVLNLLPHQAAVLVAEGWAEETERAPTGVLDVQSKKTKTE